MSSDLNYARFCSLLDSTDPPLVRRKSSKWKVLSQNWWDSLRDESRQELDQWALAVVVFAGGQEGRGGTCWAHPPDCVQNAVAKNAWHRNFHGLPAAEEAEAVKQDEVLDVFRAICTAAEKEHQKRCHAWQAMKQQSSPNSGGFLGDGLRQTLRKKLSGISLRRSSSPPLDSQYRAIGHRAARWYGTSKEAWDAGEAF
ncbi:RHTO0S04e10880g1_1 [Rhodotorula toruloides]|uniref:RHTO0S04e10880g1_1 n=1 Tax=Rhodotorula toruloides TaxID=5286 RepID=A0A061AWS6_RHOTO|nr:RHTO0S04e10880g1_1 [Rhodotorula toruloides]